MPSRIACLRFAKLVAFSVLLIAALCLVPPAWGRDFGEWPDIPAVMAGGVSDEEVEETMGRSSYTTSPRTMRAHFATTATMTAWATPLPSGLPGNARARPQSSSP